MVADKFDIGAFIQRALTLGAAIVLLIATIFGDPTPRPITTGIVVFGVLVVTYIVFRLPILTARKEKASTSTKTFSILTDNQGYVLSRGRRILEILFITCLVLAMGWRTFTSAKGASQEWDPRKCPYNSNTPTVLISRLSRDSEADISEQIYNELTQTIGKVTNNPVEFCIYERALSALDLPQVFQTYNPYMIVWGNTNSSQNTQIYVTLQNYVDLGNGGKFDLDDTSPPPPASNVDSAIQQVKLRVRCYLAQDESFKENFDLANTIYEILFRNLPLTATESADSPRLARCEYNAAQIIAQNLGVFYDVDLSRTKAIELFSDTIRNDPKQFDARLNRAGVKAEMGVEWSEIEVDYQYLFDHINDTPSSLFRDYAKAPDTAFRAYINSLNYYAELKDFGAITELSNDLLLPYQQLKSSENQNPLHYHYAGYIQLVLQLPNASQTYDEGKQYFSLNPSTVEDIDTMIDDLENLLLLKPELRPSIEPIIASLIQNK